MLAEPWPLWSSSGTHVQLFLAQLLYYLTGFFFYKSCSTFTLSLDDVNFSYIFQAVDEYVWQDLTLVKADLLEARAKLMVRGGQYDAAEELCRTCINIRTVMLGADHPNTVFAQETLAKFGNAHKGFT